MNEAALRNYIVRGFKHINKRNTIELLWRTSIYTLPFFTVSNNFEYWKKEDIQSNLQNIFHALDLIIKAAYIEKKEDLAHINSLRMMNNSNDHKETLLALDSIEIISPNKCVSYAIHAISSALKAAYSQNSDIEIHAKNTCIYCIKSSINSHQGISLLQPVLLGIKSATKNEKRTIRKSFYGNIWNDFHKTLSRYDCSYWYNFIENIFNSEFNINKDNINRRINVPKEIRSSGASSSGDYLKELEKGETKLNEARIIILGDKGAGKTSIARKLVNSKAKMPKLNESTAGVDTSVWEIEDDNLNIRIWDFAGHTVTHAVHQFFLSERCLYIMVYNSRTENTSRLEFWLNHMKNFGGNSRALILVNLCDEHTPDIPIRSLKDKYPILDIDYFSIKEDESKLEVFKQKVKEYIRKNPCWKNQEMPTSYYKVKIELENYFNNSASSHGLEHISKEHFESIARKNKVENPAKLLEALHMLGISLWYKDMEKYNTLILNPEWISEGVYQIINWVNESIQYSLTIDDFNLVFSDNIKRFPIDKHQFLFDLMIKYELAYKTEGKESLIIPHLLKEDRPEELPHFELDNSLIVKYKSDQTLPPNTISRFIVRHNKQISSTGNEYNVWRYGVILKDNTNCIALVKEDDDRTISLRVKGNDSGKFLQELRATLDHIFDSYKSSKPTLEYNITQYGKIPDNTNTPIWLPEKRIINHVARNKDYFDDTTGSYIPLKPVVNHYHININDSSVIMGGNKNEISNDNSQVFNFKDCNMNMQGKLNELSRMLAENDLIEDSKDIKSIAKSFEENEILEKSEEVKKSGILNRLEKVFKELENKDSKLYSTLQKVKHGIGITQDLAEGYNNIAQWLALPQVPKPFLKK